MDYKGYFDREIERRNTGSIKWDRYKDKDIIPLWVADMDFASPPAVIEALQQHAAHGVFGYTHAPEELLEIIIHRLQKLYNWAIARDWLVWLPGLVSGLNVVCRTAGDDGDAALTNTPIYPPFLSAPGLSRRKLVTADLCKVNNRWEMDFDILNNAVTPETRLFLFCNPHNPTGRIYTKAELQQVATFCEQHDLVICSDEIHCDLLLDADKRHIPLASLDEAIAQRTITLMAPSKTYNMPGLGCAFAIIPNAYLRTKFRRVMEGIVPYINALGYTAAQAAYRDGGPWLEALLAYLAGNRDLLQERVAALPGITMTPVQATYLAWLDVHDLGLENPAAFFETQGLGFSDGAEFGAPGFLRLNFGCPRSLLTEALNRLEKAVGAIK
ncbi:MAG TPA: PatB family C-S lyase [bacterium]|nr:PatB family C-S lyase [bacterium]HPN46009.1 PatB family C-S lyase [bacterium]